ncbi:MAG: cbb3-type cytochrome oxidase assembly protein CcoS [Gammaproteobacteria bacterium]
MIALLVIVALSTLLAVGIGTAFFWEVENDPLDDLDATQLLPPDGADAPRAADLNAAD